MSDAFGWAHFGDAGREHNLIDATGIDDDTLKALRWQTDLSQDAPTNWPAYYAGYAIQDYYVVQFTEPDPGAGRSGMVKTTLATVGIDELGEVELTDLRRHARSASVAAAPVSCNRLDGLGAVVDLLAEARDVYWLGASVYDTLLDQLWAVLSAADRADLVFGLLCTPSSVPYPQRDSRLGVYLVPEQLRARFDPTSTINADDPPPAGNTSRAVLASNSEIATELGLESPSLRDWRHLAKASQYLDDASSSDPDQLRACGHLLSRLAPGPQRGRAVKARIASLLVESAANASFADVRGMRTLNLADLGLDLDAFVEPWAAAVIGDPNRIEDLQAALSEVAAHPRDPLCDAIDAVVNSQIAARGQEIVDYLEAAVATDRRAVFAALADRADPERIDTGLASLDGIGSREWVHEVAQQARLPMAHSQSCPTGEPTEAFRAHLAIPAHTPASRSRLASRCEPRGVVEAAVALGAPVLVELAAQAVHQDADALLPAHLTSRCWLAIWARTVEGGADPWTWMEPRDALEPVVDALLGGDDNAKSLVAALAAADGIDLASYPRRAEVWSAIDEPARSRLLCRTAIAVVLDGSATASIEPALRRAIVGKEVMSAVAVIDVSKAIDALDNLASHANSRTAKVIVAASELGADAARIGEIIARNGWKRAARYVVANASQRSDLKAAAVMCRRLLSPLEVLKIKVRGSKGSASDDELSAGVHEIAVTLFPNGPNEAGIWARAGGDEADLVQQGTGRQRWERALLAVTTGAAGAPTLASLIDEMLRDFPKNPQLKIVRKAI